jgi:hypothetical protein
MAQLFPNFISGVTDAILYAAGTSLSAPVLAALPLVDAGDTVTLVLDPEDEASGPEVLTVTYHATSATVATVTRAQEGTSDVEHPVGTKVIAALTEAGIEAILSSIGTNATNISTNSTNLSNHVGTGGDAHANAVAGSTSGFISGTDQEKLDNIEAEAQVNPTNQELLDQIKVVDGPGSGINADLLDGHHVSELGPYHTHNGMVTTTDLANHHDASSTDHDDRYYYKSQVDSLLGTKTPLTTAKEEAGFFKGLASGDTKISVSTTQNYQKGIAYSNASFGLRCNDIGADTRQIYFFDDSSTERHKHDIEPSEFEGGECLKWPVLKFRKNIEGDDGKVYHWTVAERIQEISGDDYVVRDDEGQVQNTDDRAMIADMILTIQNAYKRIEALEERVAALEGS